MQPRGMRATLPKGPESGLAAPLVEHQYDNTMAWVAQTNNPHHTLPLLSTAHSTFGWVRIRSHKTRHVSRRSSPLPPRSRSTHVTVRLAIVPRS